MTEKNHLMRERLEKPRRIKVRYSQKTRIIAQRARINGEDKTRYAHTIAKRGSIFSIGIINVATAPINSNKIRCQSVPEQNFPYCARISSSHTR